MQLIYNVMLASGIQQSDSVIYICIFIYFYVIFHVLSIMVYCRILNMVFCAIQCCAMLSHFSCVQLFVTLWRVAHPAPLSKGFSR